MEMPQRLAAGLPFFRCQRPAGIHVALGVVKEIGKIHADPRADFFVQIRRFPFETGEKIEKTTFVNLVVN